MGEDGINVNNNIFTDQESLSLKEKEEKIRKRIALEKKAFDIVHQLIEPGITSEYLIQIGNLITPSHYLDVTEERAITKLCGYPLCDKLMRSVLKQKYHISTKCNKVYDISERKNFCSNECFKASKYFESQIPTSPVWARDNEPKVEFKILENGRGSAGEEVVGIEDAKQILKNEVEQLKKLDTLTSKTDSRVSQTTNSVATTSEFIKTGSQTINETENNSGNVSQISETGHPEKVFEKPTQESKSEYMLRLLAKKKNHLAKMADDRPLDLHVQSSGTQESSKLDKEKNSTSEKVKNSKENKTSVSDASPLEFVCCIIKQWMTDKSRNFLKKKSYELMCDNFEQEYTMLCHRLEQRERESEKLEEILSEKLHINDDKVLTQPLPDYQQLQVDSKTELLKVREFYNGNFYHEKDLETIDKNQETENEKIPVVLPTVDSNDQMIIRRRIVFERIMKIMPDILSPLKLNILDVTEDLRLLLQTFSFSSSNIIFKPAQWTLVGLVILKLLAQKSKKIESSFVSSTSVKYLNILLTAIKHSQEDFNIIVNNIL